MTDDKDRDAEARLRERMLQDGIKQTVRFVMDRNPEMSADEARAYIKRHIDEETERIKALAVAHRWEPRLVHGNPVGTGQWSGGSGYIAPARCTLRVRREGEANAEHITICVATCDVEAWSEARDKDRAGTIGMSREQATYLRDALTVMLERSP